MAKGKKKKNLISNQDCSIYQPVLDYLLKKKYTNQYSITPGLGIQENYIKKCYMNCMLEDCKSLLSVKKLELHAFHCNSSKYSYNPIKFLANA